MDKPIHAKPSLYSYYFEALKQIAKEFGYNLVVHGSMNRDLDLIAIPWTDDPKSEFEMIKEFSDYMNGFKSDYPVQFLYKTLPGGRKSYVINLNRGGYRRNNSGEISEPVDFTKDPEYYIDISVTPLLKSPDSQPSDNNG